MKNKLVAWLAVIGWMSLIFILSHQPASISSGLSSGITKFLLNFIVDLFPGIGERMEEFHTLVRKNAHFIAYFVLGALLVNAWGRWKYLRGRDFIISFAIALLYALSDEFHQLFIEGRSGELRDVLIDSSGAATGIFFCWAADFIVHKRRKADRQK